MLAFSHTMIVGEQVHHGRPEEQNIYICNAAWQLAKGEISLSECSVHIIRHVNKNISVPIHAHKMQFSVKYHTNWSMLFFFPFPFRA